MTPDAIDTHLESEVRTRAAWFIEMVLPSSLHIRMLSKSYRTYTGLTSDCRHDTHLESEVNSGSRPTA